MSCALPWFLTIIMMTLWVCVCVLGAGWCSVQLRLWLSVSSRTGLLECRDSTGQLAARPVGCRTATHTRWCRCVVRRSITAAAAARRTHISSPACLPARLGSSVGRRPTRETAGEMDRRTQRWAVSTTGVRCDHARSAARSRVVVWIGGSPSTTVELFIETRTVVGKAASLRSLGGSQSASVTAGPRPRPPVSTATVTVGLRN